MMHLQRSSFDVVVVGARAAGAATAMLLARRGARVLVVDRSAPGTDTLSTHALMRGGVLQLARWGLLGDVVAAGTPAVRRSTFVYADEQVEVPIKPAHGVDALYAPRRTVLDPILVYAAAAAGATIGYGITVTGVRRDGDGRAVGITAADERGRDVDVVARIVVGADGRRSTVARHVGAPIERHGTSAGAYVYGYWSDLPTAGYEWIFRPGAVAGLIPTNDGATCVFAGSTPPRIGRGGMRTLQAVLAAASPAVAARLAQATPPAGVRTFTGLPGFVRRSWGPGWALVGDAGHWKDPISAHGLTDALRDAELLARAIIAVLDRRAAEPDALAAYQAQRDRLSSALFDVTDVIAGHRWRDAEIGDLLVALSAAMADEVSELAALDEAVAAPG